MADAALIQQLRDLVGEPDDSNGWTDVRLDEVLTDHNEELNVAASHVWGTKAATYASLVNVSEAGSSRSLSDLHKNALRMSDRFAALSGVASRPRIRDIVRP